MTQSVASLTAAMVVAAMGLGACTDITPWAYPTEPGPVAQQGVMVDSAPLLTAPRPTPAKGTLASRRAAARPIVEAPATARPIVEAPAAPRPIVAVPSPAPVEPAPPEVVYTVPQAVVVAPVAPPPVASAQRLVVAPVYAPAGPALVEKSGLIDAVLSNNSGRADGVILMDNTVIRFSPDFGAAMDPDGSRLAPGRPIVVRGNWAGKRDRSRVLNAVEMGPDIYSLVTLGNYGY